MASRKSRSSRRQDPLSPLSPWSLTTLLLGNEAVRTLYLWGPPGIGKTYTAYRSGRLEAGFYAITLTEDSAASEMRGFYAPRKGKLRWQDGPFTEAMRRGARLVINEISHASPECLSLLHPVLESTETARLTLPTGETVAPAPGFHVVVTDNSPPEDLPEALRDRFDAVVHLTEPHPEALARLEEPFRSGARRTCGLGDERSISLRGWLGIQRLVPDLGLEGACRVVLGAERGALVFDSLRLADDGKGGAA